MHFELIFKIIFIIAGIFMMGIRIYYQRKILPDKERTTVRGNPLKLIPGAIAALVTFGFSFEYIFAQGTFKFAYVVEYPVWLRWMGVILIIAGIALLWSTHRHLDRSFHSLVVRKEEQVLIQTGPYRYVRHPMYTAYITNYIAGGVLAANVVLTFVPFIFFALMIFLRIGEEEGVMIEQFGDAYGDYMNKTGRFVPRIFPSKEE